jgi:DNA-directed RNA polymerase specialized sigma24 family protein
MASQNSVTHWIGLLQGGDAMAAQPLWERYFQRLVGLARKKLQGASRRAADEEDVALSAFDSFCRNARNGRFPRLADRDDLWRLLVVITARKASHLVRDESRQKRGGGRRAGDGAGSGTESGGLEQVLGREPSPQFAAQVVEEYHRLLAGLGDPQLEAVAVAKMEGYTNDEIAVRLECAPRTVERKLQLIRTLWERETGP